METHWGLWWIILLTKVEPVSVSVVRWSIASVDFGSLLAGYEATSISPVCTLGCCTFSSLSKRWSRTLQLWSLANFKDLSTSSVSNAMSSSSASSFDFSPVIVCLALSLLGLVLFQSASNSSSHPRADASFLTPSSQSPRRRTSSARQPRSPTLSELISNRGTFSAHEPGRLANGRTVRLVPNTMHRSAQRGKPLFLWNSSGNFSPKKTISGLTRPLHCGFEQWGTSQSVMASFIKCSG